MRARGRAPPVYESSFLAKGPSFRAVAVILHAQTPLRYSRAAAAPITQQQTTRDLRLGVGSDT